MGHGKKLYPTTLIDFCKCFDYTRLLCIKLAPSESLIPSTCTKPFQGKSWQYPLGLTFWGQKTTASFLLLHDFH